MAERGEHEVEADPGLADHRAGEARVDLERHEAAVVEEPALEIDRATMAEAPERPAIGLGGDPHRRPLDRDDVAIEGAVGMAPGQAGADDDVAVDQHVDLVVDALDGERPRHAADLPPRREAVVEKRRGQHLLEDEALLGERGGDVVAGEEEGGAMGTEAAAARLRHQRQAGARHQRLDLGGGDGGLGELEAVRGREAGALGLVGEYRHQGGRRHEDPGAGGRGVGLQGGEEAHLLVAAVEDEARPLLGDQPAERRLPRLGLGGRRHEHGAVGQEVAGGIGDRVGGDDADGLAHRREAERHPGRRDAADAGNENGRGHAGREVAFAAACPNTRSSSAVIAASSSATTPGWLATQTLRS